MLAKIPKPVLVATLLVAATTLSLLLVNIDDPSYTEPFFLGGQASLPFVKKTDTITPLIQEETADLPGKYAIYIKDLKSQESSSLNPDEKFASASLYKLAVMYKAFDALDKGEIQRQESVSGDKAYLDQRVSGKENVEDLGREESTEVISSPIDEALRLMITISDNYSAILLAEKLGWAKIDTFMEEKGLAEINLVGPDSPNLTARATAQLLEQIYNNGAVSPKASEEMKKLLFAQKINDRIPKYLPRDIQVGHKTGELGAIRHDAGIVLGKRSHYIFVFLSETPAPLDAAENIALLSKKIFDELEK